MNSLEDELERARRLEEDELAATIESIGFECTRCGACCRAETCANDTTDGVETDGTQEEHTATVFPEEVRSILSSTDGQWRDVARPMPYGLDGGTEGNDTRTGETFEWALQTDGCGDCVFFEETDEDGTSACSIYGNRPLICQTYPFSLALGGTSQPMGEAIEEVGLVRAHECEGLGRDINPEDAYELATTLKRRTIRELEEAIAVRDAYQPVVDDGQDVIVFDSEGPKDPDGNPIE